MKEFLLLIRESAGYGELSVEEMQASISEHIRWIESLDGHFKEGNPLEASGLTLKNQVVTDGPYVETKECVSGYYFLLANSLEEAGELAKGCPDLQRGATLEIREIINTDE
ncbi:YciI family protein [Leadbetterella sp. DM7]|uniref:YciI family protein n=1 Tax=Leadbetterella sp. DM7 TaxID=3235085 RepID=UPI00349EDBF0